MTMMLQSIFTTSLRFARLLLFWSPENATVYYKDLGTKNFLGSKNIVLENTTILEISTGLHISFADSEG